MARASSSPISSASAPVIQTPERSGLPSAARGIGFEPVGGATPAWAWTDLTRADPARSVATAIAAAVFTNDATNWLFTLLSSGARRRSGSQLASVAERHLTRGSEVRFFARPPTKDGDRFANLQSLPFPALPDQHVRGVPLELPLSGRARVALHIHIEMNVGIRPIDLGDGAGHRDGLVCVVLSSKGVMGEEMRGREEETARQSTGSLHESVLEPGYCMSFVDDRALLANCDHFASASCNTRPSTRGSATPARNANVGATSAGLASVVYSPRAIPLPMRNKGTRAS